MTVCDEGILVAQRVRLRLKGGLAVATLRLRDMPTVGTLIEVANASLRGLSRMVLALVRSILNKTDLSKTGLNKAGVRIVAVQG